MTAKFCSYDSGAATDCVPLCSKTATHIVVHRNGSYGPFESPMCERHVRPMEGRVYPGHIETIKIEGE